MGLLKYTCTFDGLSDHFRRFTIQSSDDAYDLQIEVRDGRLLPKRTGQMPSIVADLIDLAVAVYVVDWLAVRRRDERCSIDVVLPLRHPEIYGGSRISSLITGALHWYTEDTWNFDFTPRVGLSRPIEGQGCYLPSSKNEVALWSGGLDSLAGLCCRLRDDPAKHFVLFGTGSNSRLYKLQRSIATQVRKQLHGHIDCVRLPIRLQGSHGIRKNPLFRARGFAFLALGAACAYLEGQDTLHIYENGIGAINLPFRGSEVGLEHSRGVHPISLLRMSDLVSALFGMPFYFRNPFLFKTKAEMCQVFNYIEDRRMVFQTLTCDGLRREKTHQCGHCSSCLLRRQALAAADIPDCTEYATPANTCDMGRDQSHLRAMLVQVETIESILRSAAPWIELSARFPELADIVDQTWKSEQIVPEVMETQLLDLYERYCSEWKNMGHTFVNGLVSGEERLAVRDDYLSLARE